MWNNENGIFINDSTTFSIGVRWRQNGAGTIGCFIINASGCKSPTSKNSIKILDTKMHESSLNNIKVYPIPANTELNVSIPDGFKDGCQIHIYNIKSELRIESTQRTPGMKILDVSTLEVPIWHLQFLNSSLAQT